MAVRLDSWIPDYAANLPVTSGVAWYGPLIPGHGVVALTVQIASTNGAAGTCYIFGTNFDGIPPLINSSTGMPQGVQLTNVALSGVNVASINMGITSTGIGVNKFYLQFTPTVSGNIYIAVNMRRNSA